MSVPGVLGERRALEETADRFEMAAEEVSRSTLAELDAELQVLSEDTHAHRPRQDEEGERDGADTQLAVHSRFPMTDPPGIDISDHLGPVSFLAVQFSGSQTDGGGFTRLVDLVDKGLVLVLDLEFVRRMPDGSLVTVPAGSVDLDVDLSAFEGADSGLLDRDDLDLVAGLLEEGDVMAVLVYEDLALNPVLQAWAAAGARLVAEGSVDGYELETAIEAAEAAGTT